MQKTNKVIGNYENKNHDIFNILTEILNNSTGPVFASTAPSIAGQFGEDISVDQLRTAFLYLGFTDMIEVALFADILTIKEAYEFNRLVKTEKDFFLTSCCCPIWVKLVERKYPEIFDHMSMSISPMIASGRFLKKIYPEARVIFISPCKAKKVEANDPELQGAVDLVITFRELKDYFTLHDVDPADMYGTKKDQASYAGRIYGRTGGVSFSVKSVVNRIAPQRLINFRAKKVDGIQNCRKILTMLSKGKDIGANFIEGMACVGGCVGGPQTNIKMQKAAGILNNHGENSLIMTPMDNKNILEILQKLGLSNYSDIYNAPEIGAILTREKVLVEK